LQAELAPSHCVFPRMDRDKYRPRAIHLQQLARIDLDTCHHPLNFRRWDDSQFCEVFLIGKKIPFLFLFFFLSFSTPTSLLPLR
jgi:hypothetical protein